MGIKSGLNKLKRLEHRMKRLTDKGAITDLDLIKMQRKIDILKK